MRNYQTRTDVRSEIDQGLRKYMIMVYNYMAAGIGFTGLMAYLVSTSDAFMIFVFTSPIKWLVLLAPLAVVFFFSAKINTMSFSTAQGVFWLFAGLLGISMSVIFKAYTGTSIARVFFITSSLFAGMSLYGYTTGRDLTSFGSFLFMGLIGVIIASVVNMFVQSTAMQKVVSVIAVLVFTGLTAYDTQNIKQMYIESDDYEVTNKKALLSSLTLYLNFINLFQSLLHLMGDRR